MNAIFPAAARALFLAAVWLSGCTQVAPAAEPRRVGSPAATTATPVPPAPAGVAAANPLAVDAGLEILTPRRSAPDAAVAIQATLGWSSRRAPASAAAVSCSISRDDEEDHRLRRPRGRAERRERRHVPE